MANFVRIQWINLLAWKFLLLKPAWNRALNLLGPNVRARLYIIMVQETCCSPMDFAELVNLVEHKTRPEMLMYYDYWTCNLCTYMVTWIECTHFLLALSHELVIFWSPSRSLSFQWCDLAQKQHAINKVNSKIKISVHEVYVYIMTTTSDN